ncbi:MAG TPA: hypothetical protein VF183_07330 [Acidimicrobiales bacterium]
MADDDDVDDDVAEKMCPDCGAPLRFDPDLIGETCGGVTLRGWNVCTSPTCGKGWLSRLGVPAEGEWRLSTNGGSVETGSNRIRMEKRDEMLAARIRRLPDLERALRRIAAGEDDPSKIAAEAIAKIVLHDPTKPAVAPRALIGSTMTCRKGHTDLVVEGDTVRCETCGESAPYDAKKNKRKRGGK